MSLQCDNLSGELQDQWSSSSCFSLPVEIKRQYPMVLPCLTSHPLCLKGSEVEYQTGGPGFDTNLHCVVSLCIEQEIQFMY